MIIKELGVWKGGRCGRPRAVTCRTPGPRVQSDGCPTFPGSGARVYKGQGKALRENS